MAKKKPAKKAAKKQKAVKKPAVPDMASELLDTVHTQERVVSALRRDMDTVIDSIGALERRLDALQPSALSNELANLQGKYVALEQRLSELHDRVSNATNGAV